MSKVKIEGNASGTGTLTISAPATNTDRTINLPDDDITLSAFPDAIDVNASAPADSLNIDASGNVGIGETSPFTRLHIKEGDSGATDVWGNTGLVVENSADARLTLLSGTSNIGSIKFGDSGLNRQGGIDYNHNGDSMTFATTNTERMRITSDGRGLSQFTAKAWIKLHQGNNSIYDSHNVSSISHPESGQTLVNFSNSMGDTDYCAVASSGQFYTGNTGIMDFYSGSFRVVNSSSSSYTDNSYVNVIVFGD